MHDWRLCDEPIAVGDELDTAPSTDKTLRIYDGLFHDLLHEPKHELVAKDILASTRTRTAIP